MPTFFVIIALLWTTMLLAASVWAVLRAKAPLRRLLALDTVTIILVAMLALAAHAGGRSYLLDSALLIALIAFVGTLAAAHYHSEGRPF